MAGPTRRSAGWTTLTSNSLIGRVAGAAIADAGIEAHEVDSTFVSLFNGGFSAQDFPASLVLQHVPELRFKPITRFENACASGSAAVYGARDFLLSGRGRIALVIGVEKMTATPGAEIGDILLKASYRKEEADIPAGFAGVFGRIADTLFPALRRPVGRAGGDRGEEPQERRGQSVCADAQRPRVRVLPHCQREEPVCRSAIEANRLLPGVRRRRGAGHGGRGHGRGYGQGGALQSRGPGQRFPADQQAEYYAVRRCGGGVGAGVGGGGCFVDRSVLCRIA